MWARRFVETEQLWYFLFELLTEDLDHAKDVLYRLPDCGEAPTRILERVYFGQNAEVLN